MVSKTPLKRRAPAISVLMPAYNAEKYIAEAIESILMQTFKNFELIIVDDASTDGTWKIVQKYARDDKRIIIIKNGENLKLSKTLNIAIDISSGKYLARMDSDDWSYPYRLENQYEYLEKHKKVGLVGGSMEIMRENGDVFGKRSYPTNDMSIRKKIFWYSPFSHPLVMIRKSILEKAGGYNHNFNPAEDYELYFRLGEFSKFANLTEVLLKYRIIKKSMTTGSTKQMEQKTIEIRKIYAKSRKYKISLLQKFYNIFHQFSLYIIPSRFKIYIFNYLRDKRI